MFLQHKFLAFGLTIAAGFALASPALAEHTIPAKGSADGQLLFQIDATPEEPGVQVAVAYGSSNLLGPYTQTSITYFTLEGAVTGSAIWTASDGSTFSFNFEGIVAPISGTPDFQFDLSASGGTGTGRLDGVTLEGTAHAVLSGVTGAFYYDIDGVWILP